MRRPLNPEEAAKRVDEMKPIGRRGWARVRHLREQRTVLGRACWTSNPRLGTNRFPPHRCRNTGLGR